MLYFGPETYMPLASAIAAVAGVLLAFWRRLVGGVRRIFHPVSHDHAAPHHRHHVSHHGKGAA
ncbi:MAG: hypothetical protein P8099_07900 [Gemmatimonadota bacterium]|jgi:hypothetical protein